jgi:hypothetical protein
MQMFTFLNYPFYSTTVMEENENKPQNKRPLSRESNQ